MALRKKMLPTIKLKLGKHEVKQTFAGASTVFIATNMLFGLCDARCRTQSC